MKYDVAISFCWEDVDIARQLFEALRDRLEVFFSDDRQQEVVGTDGEESFGLVFRDQARIVVVFYRKVWGKTKFTAAEESAIKQRAGSEGYSFTIWVPLDEDRSVPPYLPPQQLWFDFERYGIGGLAPIVEERVRQSGKDIRRESTVDKLRKIDRQLAADQRRKEFIGSPAALEFLQTTRQSLEAEIEEILNEFREVGDKVRFQLSHEQRMWNVTSWPNRCWIWVEQVYGNTASESHLAIQLQRSHEDRYAQTRWSDSRKFVFEPTLDSEGEPAWESEKGTIVSLSEALRQGLDELALDAYKHRAQNLKKR